MKAVKVEGQWYVKTPEGLLSKASATERQALAYIDKVKKGLVVPSLLCLNIGVRMRGSTTMQFRKSAASK